MKMQSNNKNLSNANTNENKVITSQRSYADVVKGINSDYPKYQNIVVKKEKSEEITLEEKSKQFLCDISDEEYNSDSRTKHYKNCFTSEKVEKILMILGKYDAKMRLGIPLNSSSKKQSNNFNTSKVTKVFDDNEEVLNTSNIITITEVFDNKESLKSKTFDKFNYPYIPSGIYAGRDLRHVRRTKDFVKYIKNFTKRSLYNKLSEVTKNFIKLFNPDKDFPYLSFGIYKEQDLNKLVKNTKFVTYFRTYTSRIKDRESPEIFNFISEKIENMMIKGGRYDGVYFSDDKREEIKLYYDSLICKKYFNSRNPHIISLLKD